MKARILIMLIAIAGEAMATEIPNGERKAFIEQFVKNCMKGAMTPAAVSRYGGERIGDFCACSAVGTITRINYEDLLSARNGGDQTKVDDASKLAATGCTLKLVGR